MPRKLNPMGKSRTADDPYLIVQNGTWQYRVLKAYSLDPDAPYARWFCVVVTPYTGRFGDMGDTYIADVFGPIIHRDPAVTDECLPSHLRSN